MEIGSFEIGKNSYEISIELKAKLSIKIKLTQNEVIDIVQ